MKKIQKALLVILAVALACSMGVFLGACAPNSEQIIRDGVSKDLDSIKDKNPADIDTIKAGLTSVFGDTDTDVDGFVNSWLDGFDYHINTVNVQENNATVSVDITVKQLGPILDAVSDDFTKEASADSASTELTEEELFAKLMTDLTAAVAAAQPTTTSVDLSYVLTNNTWDAAPEFQAELERALLGTSRLLSESTDAPVAGSEESAAATAK